MELLLLFFLLLAVVAIGSVWAVAHKGALCYRVNFNPRMLEAFRIFINDSFTGTINVIRGLQPGAEPAPVTGSTST
jgi:hypothetical protein